MTAPAWPVERARQVGVGELWVLRAGEGHFITHALGSCVGVALYDARAGVGGLLHFMLPDSSLNPAQACERPGMYGDTGMVRLLSEAFALGATRKGTKAWLAGGARVIGGGMLPDIGSRNLVVARRMLWKNSICVFGEDTGGDQARTLVLDLERGEARVRRQGVETVL